MTLALARVSLPRIFHHIPYALWSKDEEGDGLREGEKGPFNLNAGHCLLDNQDLSEGKSRISACVENLGKSTKEKNIYNKKIKIHNKFNKYLLKIFSELEIESGTELFQQLLIVTWIIIISLKKKVRFAHLHKCPHFNSIILLHF